MTDLERRILLRLLATGCLSLPWLSPSALAQGPEALAGRAHRRVLRDDPVQAETSAHVIRNVDHAHEYE
jgi:hypothetical protein